MIKIFIVLFLFFSFKNLISSEVKNHRTFVLGDIHGNKQHALKLLELTGAFENNDPINPKNLDSLQWKSAETLGSKVTIIQLGDILDRGSDDIEILNLFHRLRLTAKNAGHEMILVLGNHEILNASGDFSYASSQRLEVDNQSLLFGNKLAKEVLAKNVTVLIQNEIIYAHGGLSIEFLVNELKFNHLHVQKLSYTPTKLIDDYNLLLSSYLNDQSFYISSFLSLFTDKEKMDLIKSQSKWSPAWYRGYITEIHKPEKKVCENLKSVLAIFNAKKMVVAHTPQNSIGTTCDGLLLHTDTGAWNFNANNMIAEILHDQLDDPLRWFIIYQ